MKHIKLLTRSWHHMDRLQQSSALALLLAIIIIPVTHSKLSSPHLSKSNQSQSITTNSDHQVLGDTDYTYLSQQTNYNQHEASDSNQFQPSVLGAQDSPANSNQTTTPALTSLTQACQAANGTITQFPHSCADLCITQDTDGLPRPGTSCAQTITTSCDCGPSACWNGTTCQSFTTPESAPTNLTQDTQVLGASDSANIATNSGTIQDSTDSADLENTTPSCLPSDFNGDGTIDMLDRQYIIDYFFTDRSSFDLNHDNIVDIRDYSILVNHWHQQSECLTT